jgi:hypothetical protein
MQWMRFFGWVLLATALLASWAQKPLDDYFQRPEPAYHWEKRETKRVDGVTTHTLFMISQTWQGDDTTEGIGGKSVIGGER